MAKVVPSAPRARIIETGEALRVVIPAPRNYFALVFLPIWLAGWAFGEVMAFRSLLTGKAHGPAILFLLVWLTLWTAGGALALFYWFWNLAGREEITVDSGGDLLIRYAVYGLGKTWEFDRAVVRNLRVSETGAAQQWVAPYLSGMGSARYGGIWHGPFAFDYGAKTYRFGAGMDEAEACDLLPHLLRRLSPDDPDPKPQCFRTNPPLSG